MNTSTDQTPFDEFPASVIQARRRAAGSRRKGRGLVFLYWRIGRALVRKKDAPVEEQRAFRQALADRLELSPGRFDRYAAFYQAFPDEQILRSGLSWTHFKMLLRLSSEEARAFYFQETAHNHWSTRELNRQMNARYFERSLASQLKIASDTASAGFLKEPLVFEFLKPDLAPGFEEKELERALLNKLQTFLLELGKGFAFVARQKRIFTETGRRFYIDLVFYHFILKCFVLIDLKTGELTHQDIGQMDMYVRLYEDKWRRADDQPTLGIILCSEKDHTVVRYSMLNDSRQLFASRYQLYLPTEEDLKEVMIL